MEFGTGSGTGIGTGTGIGIEIGIGMGVGMGMVKLWTQIWAPVSCQLTGNWNLGIGIFGMQVYGVIETWVLCGIVDGDWGCVAG